MRVLVTGPRTWGVIPNGVPDVSARATQARAEAACLQQALDDLKPTVVIHGGAAGADTWAGLWATSKGVKQHSCPAPFAYLGPVAGILRNTYMLTMHRPDVVVVCGPGGTPGTDDCFRQAFARGIEIMRIQI